MMLSHSVGQAGNSITGAIDHTGTGFYGSNIHVGGNLIISALNLPKSLENSIDLACNIKLLDDFIEVLQYTVASLPNYQNLVDELHRLRKAVVAISKLGFGETGCQRSLAVRQAIQKLQNSIETFLRPTAQDGTRRITSDVDWRVVLWGIQWAQYENKNIEIFRAELEGHTSAIETLLITLQISAKSPPPRKDLDQQWQNVIEQCTLVKTQDGIADNSALLHGLNQQQTELIQSLIQTIQQQQAIIQQQNKLPPQIELRKPVILEDACGRVAPFHLDFINSREAFVAVLKVRFKDLGLQKIEKGEFCFQERQRKRDIDLSRPWDVVFLPGQKVDMSMIFQRSYTPDAKCHGCGAIGELSGNDFECPTCGLNCTRRIQDIEEREEIPTEGSTLEETPRSVHSSSVLCKRKISSIVEPSIQDFRRVRVLELRRQLNAHRPSSNLDPVRSSQRAEAIYPPNLSQTPVPPSWLLAGLSSLRLAYPYVSFEAFIYNGPIDTLSGKLLPGNSIDPDRTLPPNIEYRSLLTVRCNDCSGVLYAVGPGTTVADFETHLYWGHRKHDERSIGSGGSMFPGTAWNFEAVHGQQDKSLKAPEINTPVEHRKATSATLPLTPPVRQRKRPRKPRLQKMAEKKIAEAAFAATEGVTGVAASELLPGLANYVNTSEGLDPESPALLMPITESSLGDNDHNDFPILESETDAANLRTGLSRGGDESMFPFPDWQSESTFNQSNEAFNVVVPEINVDVAPTIKSPKSNTDEAQDQPERRRRAQTMEDFSRMFPQSHALVDYQYQLMLLEQQNKNRLLIARLEQEQESIRSSLKGK